ncbi:MAG: shikimate dehydrogenase [Bacteroidota bacterium]
MDHYGLIGGKLSHSFSASWFSDKFKRESIDAAYENYELTSADELPALIQKVENLRGLNVTIPFKKSIIPFLDELHSSAAECGAVNTIKIERSNNTVKLIGYNTDGPAFYVSLSPLLKQSHKKALILGTGGAAGAVSAVLNMICVPSILISRFKDNGFPVYADINERVMQEYTLVINCTPIGMFPDQNNFPELPYHSFSEAHIAYDLIYNPAETMFMKQAASFGATVKNGLDMLHRQAELAWQIWNS